MLGSRYSNIALNVQIDQIYVRMNKITIASEFKGSSIFDPKP